MSGECPSFCIHLLRDMHIRRSISMLHSITNRSHISLFLSFFSCVNLLNDQKKFATWRPLSLQTKVTLKKISIGNSHFVCVVCLERIAFFYLHNFIGNAGDAHVIWQQINVVSLSVSPSSSHSFFY